MMIASARMHVQSPAASNMDHPAQQSLRMQDAKPVAIPPMPVVIAGVTFQMPLEVTTLLLRRKQ